MPRAASAHDRGYYQGTMDYLKRALYVSVSLFLVYYSRELVADLHSAASSLPHWQTVVWGVWLATSITGIFAFAGFALPTSRLLPDSYYRIDRPEVLKTMYRALGAHWFRRLLMASFWGFVRNRAQYFDGTRGDLDRFDHNTRQSEFGHLAAFLVVLITTADLALAGAMMLSFTVCAANTFGNLYPVILQRYHRLRIQRITGFRSPQAV